MALRPCTRGSSGNGGNSTFWGLSRDGAAGRGGATPKPVRSKALRSTTGNPLESSPARNWRPVHYTSPVLAEDQETPPATLGRIALKQVRVSRQELETQPSVSKSDANPMNSLVPYLDLFERLDDKELARLAHVDAGVVRELRKQVDEINRALLRYVDLLPRLGDAELTRLTAASSKTIRFWRLCQPRGPSNPMVPARPSPDARSQGMGGEATPGTPSQIPVSRTPPPVSEPARTPTPAPREHAPTFPGFEHGRVGLPDEGGEIELSLVDDDAEPAPTEPESVVPETSTNTDDDDLAFDLSDDDFF